MVKYLRSLEPHYIIFSYGGQLISISERTQLRWYVGEIRGKNLPMCPHSQVTPVINLSTASPAAFTAACRGEKPLGEGKSNRNSWRSSKTCSSLPFPLKSSFMCRFSLGVVTLITVRVADVLANEWEPSNRIALTHVFMLHIYAVCRKHKTYWKPWREKQKLGSDRRENADLN